MDLMDLFDNKRDHKVLVTKQAIEKVKNLRIVSLSAYDNELIQIMTKKVLEYSAVKNNHNEVAITFKLFQKPDEIPVYGIAFGTEHNVNPESDSTSSIIINQMEEGTSTLESNCVVVLTHNHPSLSGISLDDVGYFLIKDKLKLLIAVTNLGKIFYIMKTNRYDRSAAFSLFKEAMALEKEASSLRDKQTAANHFLAEAFNVGISFYH